MVTSLFQKHPGPGKPLWLAPIATLTHAPFRLLVEEFGGCDGYWTEMLSAEALTNHGKYEQSYLDPRPVDKPVILQLIGYSSEAILQATAMLRDHPFAALDLNLGCSAPQILRKGGGSDWLKRKGELLNLLERMKKILKGLPLSIKTRIPDQLDSAEAFRQWLQDFPAAGVDMVAVHPRKPREKFSGLCRWDWLDHCAPELSIPLYGSGDINSPEILLRRQQGLSDGLLIGRPAGIRPWCFAHWKGLLAQKEIDLWAVLHRFFDLLEQGQPREFWPSRSKRFITHFSKNLRFQGQFMKPLFNARDYGFIKETALRQMAESPDRILNLK
jgi:tRNA-dihydrouridine synthase B